MGQRDTVSGQDKYAGFLEALEVLHVPRYPEQWSLIKIEGQADRPLRRVFFRVGAIHMIAEEFVEKVISFDDRDHYVVGLAVHESGKGAKHVTERINSR